MKRRTSDLIFNASDANQRLMLRLSGDCPTNEARLLTVAKP